jgi:CNT family concentrative nucleoside transporter
MKAPISCALGQDDPMGDVLWGIGGMVVLVGLAMALSTDRRAINWRIVGSALGLQILFAVLVLFVPWGRSALNAATKGVQAVIDSSKAGIDFLFGSAVPEDGQGFVFALQVQPTCGAALSRSHLPLRALLDHGRWPGHRRGLRPRRLRPRRRRPRPPHRRRLHGRPGALAMAKIVVPETEKVDVDGIPISEGDDEGDAETAADTITEAEEDTEEEPRNLIDAAAAGAADGLKLALNIGAMLLAFISLIALVNLIIGAIAGLFGHPDLTFETILGWIFAPIMFLIGIPWDEAVRAGSFVGQKTVVNEFVAFTNFGPVAGEFTDKSRAIVTFALTGFANLGSLGILLGGLGGLAPNRRGDIAQLGVRCVAAATLANLMSGAIAGILIH